MNSQYALRDRNGGTGSPSLRYRYPLLTGKIEMHLICSILATLHSFTAGISLRKNLGRLAYTALVLRLVTGEDPFSQT